MNMMEGKDDAISRQAAIDAFWKLDIELRPSAIDAITDMLKMLPSAQPEIIRCKECKHSEHWYKDKRRCFLWHETGIDVFEDGYCNYAERKDNGRPDQQAGCNC